MEALIPFLMKAIKITFLNLILSGDNVGVIALAIRNLPEKQAKKASLVGIFGAVGLRIIFTSLFSIIIAIEWLPVKLIGGILLVKVTWDLIKGEDESEENVKSGNTFWSAVWCIIIADLSMSLDNVLAIGAAAEGSFGLIMFGLLVSIPIIFFGSQYVVNLMQKFRIVIYIGAAVLAHTSFNMIIEDKLILPYINHILAVLLPWFVAGITLAYGFLVINKNKDQIEA